MRAITLTCAWE